MNHRRNSGLPTGSPGMSDGLGDVTIGCCEEFIRGMMWLARTRPEAMRLMRFIHDSSEERIENAAEFGGTWRW